MITRSRIIYKIETDGNKKGKKRKRSQTPLFERGKRPLTSVVNFTCSQSTGRFLS